MTDKYNFNNNNKKTIISRFILKKNSLNFQQQQKFKNEKKKNTNFYPSQWIILIIKPWRNLKKEKSKKLCLFDFFMKIWKRFFSLFWLRMNPNDNNSILERVWWQLTRLVFRTKQKKTSTCSLRLTAAVASSVLNCLSF